MSIYEPTITNPKKQLEFYKELLEQLQQENQELKKHLEVPETCNLKTLEDYKNYYQDTSKEQILEDTYIDYCAYVNLEHKYAKLKKRQKVIDTLTFIKNRAREGATQETINKLAINFVHAYLKYGEDMGSER